MDHHLYCSIAAEIPRYIGQGVAMHKREEAPDHVRVFVQNGEKEVLCLNGLAAVPCRRLAGEINTAPCSVGEAFKHGCLEFFCGNTVKHDV